jgi:hypothetical protein
MLKLVNVDSELCYEAEGSKIYYHAISPRDLDTLNGKCWKMKNGKTTLDFGASKKAVLAGGVLRWEGVQDAKGAEVPYHADLLDFLPSDTRDALYLAITGRSPVQDDDENP